MFPELLGLPGPHFENRRSTLSFEDLILDTATITVSTGSAWLWRRDFLCHVDGDQWRRGILPMCNRDNR